MDTVMISALPFVLSSFCPLTELTQVRREDYFISRFSALEDVDIASVVLGISSVYLKSTNETQVVTKCPAENLRHFFATTEVITSSCHLKGSLMFLWG